MSWSKSPNIFPLPQDAKRNYDGPAYNSHTCPECKVQIAIIGGSHTFNLQPPLAMIARKHGWGLLTQYFKGGGCDIYRGMDTNPEMRECVEFLRAGYARLLRDRPAVVFVEGTYASMCAIRDANRNMCEVAFDDASDLYKSTRGKLVDAGIRIVAFRDFPRALFNTPDCLANNGVYSPKCDHLTTVVREAAAHAARAQVGTNLIDLTHLACFDTQHTGDVNRRVCPAVIGNVCVWRDYHHLTSAFAASMANFVEDALRAVRPNRPVAWKG